MKTPEEIKKGLYLYLHHSEEDCESICDFYDCYKPETIRTGRTCGELIYEDALAYIQQLETRLAQAERERDDC